MSAGFPGGGGGRIGRWLAGAILAVAGWAGAAWAAEVAEPDEVIELPPLEVIAPEKAPPWRYAATREAEVLSRCEAAVTREFVRVRQRRLELLQLLVPEDLQARYDTRAIVILSEVRSTPAAARELVTGAEGRRARVRFLPNVWISDLDTRVVFVIVDQSRFDPDRLVLTEQHLRLQLAQRVPELPEWFVAGELGVFALAEFSDDDVTIAPAGWLSPEDAENLRTDPEFPRTLLPMRALFEAPRPPGGPADPVARLWSAQATLFVRWALAGGAERREALWSLVRRARSGRLDEATVRACLGLGYADLRDRLSDHLPEAITRPVHLRAERRGRSPKVEVHLATPGETARLKGDWDRLAMMEVKRRHPELVARYAEQAWATVAKGGREADDDARVLAVIGLFELDAGRRDEARVHLEEAARRGVVRPRVYYEVARLRYAAARAAAGDGGERLEEEQVRAVLEPLATAWRQAPPLAETYVLAADVWAHGSGKLASGDWQRLEEGLQWFPRNPQLVFLVARLHAQQGAAERAAELIERGLRLEPEPKLAALLAELREWLKAGRR